MREFEKIKKALTIELREGYFTKEQVNLGKDLIWGNKKQKLSEKARDKIKIGLCGGVFDIIHIGHIELLKDCSKNVDFLAIVVARDKNVKEKKGKSPIFPETQRVEILNSIDYVDCAILGSLDKIDETIKKVQPNIIFLGRDQNIKEEVLEKIISKLPFDIKIIRSKAWREDAHAKSSKIKKKIKEKMI